MQIDIISPLEIKKISKKAKKWADSPKQKIKEIKSVPGLRAELYPYQKEGVAYLESRNGRAIIGDEMGCISGDAVINVNRAGRGFKITLEKIKSHKRLFTLK